MLMITELIQLPHLTHPSLGSSALPSQVSILSRPTPPDKGGVRLARDQTPPHPSIHQCLGVITVAEP